MIKFFRHIRQSLISQNKMGKPTSAKATVGRYFKYAIGEILLVVIGILIALQINNWNEQKKLVQKEKEVLMAISSDIEDNISEINFLLYNDDVSVNRNLRSINLLINYLESNNNYHDSLDIHFNRANMYYEVNLRETGYQSLTSIGVDLIQKAELRSDIGEYFSSVIVQTQKAYQELRDDYYNYMLDYYRNDFIQTFDKKENRTNVSPRNYKELKNKLDYIESLKVFYDVNLYYKNEADTTLEESKSLNNKIKSYIESL